MMIVLIGPDKAGKSTLAKELVKRYPWFGYEVGGDQRIDDYEGTQRRVERLLQSAQVSLYPTIHDRFNYPDELIYSSLNKSGDMPPRIRRWYDICVPHMLDRVGTLFICCTGSLGDLTKRFRASGDTDINEEWLEQLIAAYDIWEHKCRFKILKLNSSIMTPALMLSSAIMSIDNFDFKY
jgi:deoxyadenosine/deoxycytidine kinase